MKTRRANFLQKLHEYSIPCAKMSNKQSSTRLYAGSLLWPQRKSIITNTQKNKTSKVIHVANKVINDGQKFSVSSFRQVDLIASKVFVRIHIVRDKIVFSLINLSLIEHAYRFSMRTTFLSTDNLHYVFLLALLSAETH